MSSHGLSGRGQGHFGGMIASWGTGSCGGIGEEDSSVRRDEGFGAMDPGPRITGSHVRPMAELAPGPWAPLSLLHLCHFCLTLWPSHSPSYKSTLLIPQLFFHYGDVTSHGFGLDPFAGRKHGGPVLRAPLTCPAPSKARRAAGAGSVHIPVSLSTH